MNEFSSLVQVASFGRSQWDEWRSWSWRETIWEMEECKYGSWWYVAPHWKAGSCNEDEVAN